MEEEAEKERRRQELERTRLELRRKRRRLERKRVRLAQSGRLRVGVQADVRRAIAGEVRAADIDGMRESEHESVDSDAEGAARRSNADPEAEARVAEAVGRRRRGASAGGAHGDLAERVRGRGRRHGHCGRKGGGSGGAAQTGTGQCRGGRWVGAAGEGGDIGDCEFRTATATRRSGCWGGGWSG